MPLHSPDPYSQHRRRSLRTLAIGLASFLLSLIAGSLPVTMFGPPFWPAAALVLAFGWRFGLRHGVSAGLGAGLAAWVLADVSGRALVALLAAIPGPLIALRLLASAARRFPSQDRVGALARFLAAAGFVAAPVDLLLAGVGLWMLLPESAPTPLGALLSWWLIDVVTMLLITPAILAVLGPPGLQSTPQRVRPAAGAVLAAASLGALHIALVIAGKEGIGPWLTPCFLLLALWTALRLPERACALALALVTAALFGARALTGPLTMNDLVTLLAGTVVALLVQAISADRAEAITRLREQGNEDPATGLQNDHGMIATLTERLAPEVRPSYGLLGVQIANLEVIHSLNGAERATEVEQHAASLLMRRHPEGRIARLAAGRYALLLPCDTAAELRGSARTLYAQLNAPLPTSDAAGIRIQASVGGLLIEHRTRVDPEDCLSSLAEVMTFAAGARDPQLFVEPLSQAAIDKRRERQRQIEYVRQAIREHRFALHAEPMLDPQAPAGTLCYEILTRLEHPGSGGALIMPQEFIPLAAESRLTSGLDRGVVHRVFDWLASNPRALERTHRCSINLSGPTISDPGTGTYIREQRLRFGIPAEKIVFEITESEAIRSPAAAARLLDELRSEGFSIALDDFGTGLSSFDYLKRFPVDYLKIDGSFVRHLLESPIDEEIVLATVRVARRIGIRTTAEHVRNQATLERLTALGVDVMQGELIGRPVPIDRLFERRAAERRVTQPDARAAPSSVRSGGQ